MADGTDPVDAAAAFVNPLTALGMVETMRSEGHEGLVHTVGASNLGLMLNRICLDDGVGLVNIVREPEHVELLRAAGRRARRRLQRRVVPRRSHRRAPGDQRDHRVRRDRRRRSGEHPAVPDGEGGGGAARGVQPIRLRHPQAGVRLRWPRPGTDDAAPRLRHVLVDRRVAADPVPRQDRPGGAERLRQRVADEITTTFASTYGQRLSLADTVDPDHVRRYAKMATGDKALVTPQA